MSPTDATARIARMKDGPTHLAHKAEHAVDLSGGAVVAITLQAADLGDITRSSGIGKPRTPQGRSDAIWHVQIAMTAFAALDRI